MRTTPLTPLIRPLPLVLLTLTFASLLMAAPDMDQVSRNAEELANRAASSIQSGEIFVWLATGLLVGSLVGMIATRREVGFGLAGNLGLGLAGAFFGGIIFNKLGLEFGLGELVLSYDDLLAAALGAFVLVILLLIVKSRYLKARTPAKKSKD